MKKIFFISINFFIVLSSANAQGIKGFLEKATQKDSTGKTALDKAISTVSPSSSGNAIGSGLSNADIVSGLKEALKLGADSSSKKLSKMDGYFGNAAIKILMPEEAKNVEKVLRGVGMGKLVDNAILSMNRAAEDAAGGVGDIFFTAIKQMSVIDGVKILRGGDFAATAYLRLTTTLILTLKFKPVIESALAKTGATKYWKDIFSNYNRFSGKKVNSDLPGYVTNMALKGLFYNISLEEQKIRKDPAAQVTGILQKVFGGK